MLTILSIIKSVTNLSVRAARFPHAQRDIQTEFDAATSSLTCYRRNPNKQGVSLYSRSASGIGKKL
jgi:hypothetical protein